MKIVDIRERSIAVSRYEDPGLPSGGLTTSVVAVVSDVFRAGKPVIGYGYASVGRFAQGGLIRERFAPRLLGAPAHSVLSDEGGNIDPFKAWTVMMSGEKPGGHGERCVAVGALDMALWDLAAKIDDVPLYLHLSRRLGKPVPGPPSIEVYASGGYLYPADDRERLTQELNRIVELGFVKAKIKIGMLPLPEDLARIETAARCLGSSRNLAADAMNGLDGERGVAAGRALRPFDLLWFEDVGDPLDFETLSLVTTTYGNAVAAGEALFSVPEAKLLRRHGGLRPAIDRLIFDPVHCYGLPGYLRIVQSFNEAGWSSASFWPHGGHLFSIHLVAALGLGGAELTPFAFHPFAGLAEGALVSAGRVVPPGLPGIGFEGHRSAAAVFASLL